MPRNVSDQKLEKYVQELSTINHMMQEIALNVSKPDFMDFVYDKIYSM